MCETSSSVLFFGDQSLAPRTYVQALRHLRKRATASSASLHAYSKLRLNDTMDELNRVLDWAETVASDLGLQTDPIASALVPCISQLGSVIL